MLVSLTASLVTGLGENWQLGLALKVPSTRTKAGTMSRLLRHKVCINSWTSMPGDNLQVMFAMSEGAQGWMVPVVGRGFLSRRFTIRGYVFQV